jgi:hypothetical protein
MLCDSTKNLLQTIIHSLEAPGPSAWDDQIESSKECLYEMHQMTRPSYGAYKKTASDKWPTHIPNGTDMNRAMPHVKAMVLAIRRKDRTSAIENGKAALAEMNGSRSSATSARSEGVGAAAKEPSNVVRKHEEPTRKHRAVVEKRTSARRVRVANSI